MDTTIGSVTSPDGTRIEYETSGSGVPLVLVAGALGSKGSAWQRGFAAEFAKHFRVYSYDRRGRASSGDTRPYSIEREVEDLRAVCAATAGDPVVVGISSGAALVLEAAASRVPMRAAVAFEPPYMVGSHRRPHHARYEADVRALVERDDRDGAVTLFMKTVGLPGFAVFLMRLLPMWRELRKVAHTLPYDAAIMRGFELPSARMSGIATPTLVVGGGSSPASLRNAARAVAQAIPGSRFVEVPKQSHNIKPSALEPVVREFVGSAPGVKASVPALARS